MRALKLRVDGGRNRLVLALFCLANVLLLASTAAAYTISGTVRFWDSRDQRSNNAGSRLTQSSYQTNRPLGNVLILLYDMDGGCVDFADGCGENDDDFLAGQHATSSGTYSMSVTGTQQIYILGEYVIEPTFNMVRRPDFTTFFAVSDPDATASNPPVSRSSSAVMNFNMSCPNNAVNSAPGFCDNQDEVDDFDENQAFANILASMRDGATYIQQGTGAIHAYWPNAPNGCCGGGGGCTFSNFEFCVSDGFNNHIVVHEMGHIMHARNMSGVDLSVLNLGEGTCTASNFWNGVDAGEKCVTSEGFAHLVSAATWWGQNSTSPHYRGQPLEGGSCVSSGTTPHLRRGNAARFFFDLYDSTTTGDGNDNETHSYNEIMNVWSTFDPGTANRQNRESGANGRNIEDYVFKAPWTTWPERDNNCLGAQQN